MKMTLHRLDLPLAHPFTIARGSITHQPSLVVRLEHQGISGVGEVTENSFYGQTIDSISDSLARAEPLLSEAADPSLANWPTDFWTVASRVLSPDMFALSALDMAAHDLNARLRKVAIYEAWGLSWDAVPPSSYTIGIDTIDRMIAKLQERPDWSIYKIKLGTAEDLHIVQQLRKHTDAEFRVDANCGWTCQETIDNSIALADLGVQFIEQPLPPGAPAAEKEKVFQQSALPIIADEDCQVDKDVDRCRNFFHGINVKLCKCGGLTPALKMLRRARRLGLRTMVGCMIESSIGISAAAHLLPLLDYADLDGATLLRVDPAEGVKILEGRVQLADAFGSGARLKQEQNEQQDG